VSDSGERLVFHRVVGAARNPKP